MPVGKPRKHTLLPQHTQHNLLCSSLPALDSTNTPTLTLRITPVQRLVPRQIALLELHRHCIPFGRSPSYGTVLLAHPLTCMVKERDTDTHPGIGRYTLMSRQHLSHSPNAYATSRTTLAKPHYYTDSRCELRTHIKTQERMLRSSAHQIGEVVTTIPTIGFNVECRAEYETPDV